MTESNVDEQRRRLIVIGFSARAAAFCSKRAGFEPIAIDSCADRDLMALCKQHFRLNDSSAESEIVHRYGSLPYVMTGGMEHRLIRVDSMSENLMRGCSRAELEPMRSVWNWRNWSEPNGIRWPASWFPGEGVESLRKISASGQWLSKSRSGVGGLEIQDWVAGDSSSHSLAAHFEANPDLYLQRKIEGTSLGITFVSSQHGSTPIGATTNVDSSAQAFMPRYAYRGSYGPIVLTDPQWIQLLDFATAVGNATGFRGIWQADFIVDAMGTLFLLEINPRWSASMEILDACTDLRLVALHCDGVDRLMDMEDWQRVVIKGKNICLFGSKSVLGKLIVYASHDFIVTREQSDGWMLRVWNGDLVQVSSRCGFADIPHAGTRVSSGEPILTCLASGGSQQEIQERLRQCVAGLGH